MIKFYVIILVTTMLISCESTEHQSFKDKQLTYRRVKIAYQEKDNQLRNLFEKQGYKYPPQNIYIRIFKDEQILEVWTKTNTNATYKKVCNYEFCASSGQLGPKRQEGDLQIPEGFYYIDRFNPNSNFFLSLGINYPNESDKILGVKGNLGGDIFIHGGCATVGCIPITDDKIKELYWLAVEAKSNGQEKIPVHIFPTKLDNISLNRLKNRFQNDELLIQFWSNLKIGHDWSVEYGTIPKITVDKQGVYHFSEQQTP
ncbi:L,D-transpeptidase family protein [Candidatus Poribacteria bacterium]|nr:L,D-transpeptidase family protein [Candidatus Poribacteria bacterium]